MRMYSPIKTPIRIGLIGCGGIVQQAHLPALRILSDMALVHVNSSFSNSLTKVPIGHFQFDGSDLYVRTS